LVSAAIGAASKTNDPQLQAAILEKSKNLGENLMELLYAAKAAGGNPDAVAVQEKVGEARRKVDDSVKDLMKTLEGTGNETGAMNIVINELEDAIDNLGGQIIPESKIFFPFISLYIIILLFKTIKKKKKRTEF